MRHKFLTPQPEKRETAMKIQKEIKSGGERVSMVILSTAFSARGTVTTTPASHTGIALRATQMHVAVPDTYHWARDGGGNATVASVATEGGGSPAPPLWPTPGATGHDAYVADPRTRGRERKEKG